MTDEELNREHELLVNAKPTPIEWSVWRDRVTIWECNLHGIRCYVTSYDDDKFMGFVDIYNKFEGVPLHNDGRKYETLEQAKRNALRLAKIVLQKSLEQIEQVG